MNLKYMLSKTINNPKRMFFIDAIGALLTALLLSGILAQFEGVFGMPKYVLYLLSGNAICLFLYSICCHLIITKNWKPWLSTIIILNAIYIMLSIGFVIIYFENLTALGFLYFILEVIIIAMIIILEYRTYLKA